MNALFRRALRLLYSLASSLVRDLRLVGYFAATALVALGLGIWLGAGIVEISRAPLEHPELCGNIPRKPLEACFSVLPLGAALYCLDGADTRCVCGKK